jgi:thiamine biosynthesis protein ThiI
MKRVLLVHYGEIGLKKGNKPYFVKKLKQAIKLRLEKKFRVTFVVRHSLSRFLIELTEDFVEKDYVDILEKIAGIKNFSFCYEFGVDIQELGEKIWNLLPKDILPGGKNRPKNFRVSCKRSMLMDHKSVDMERKIGAILLTKGLELPVKLKGSDFTVNVEFLNDRSYFSFMKYEGLGGLSPNTSGRLISLLSAGIDSPVASYMMMKRGVRVIFVHFHGYPYTDADEMNQVKEIVEVLSSFQFHTKLYMVPFGEVQKSIASTVEVPAKMRTVLYRRSMLRIAEMIAKKEEAKGMVTGDSLGQVASQTPENLFTVHDASNIPLYQPLIAFDKEDVIKVAEKIGTFEISSQPCKDSCTMFMPKKPELKSNVYNTREYEESLDLQTWMTKALSEAEVIMFD